MTRRIWIVAATIAASAALVPVANAGVLVAEAGNCDPQPLEQPFQRWLDPFTYTLLSGGDFEGSPAGWTLSGGAGQASGNEPFHVHGAGATTGRLAAAASSSRRTGVV